MDVEKENCCEIPCYEACDECSCPREAEDVVLDVGKMNPEEVKNYLEFLVRSRSFGC